MPRKDFTTFRIGAELAARLEQIAQLTRRSTNSVVELALQDLLDYIDKPPSRRGSIRFVVEVDSYRLTLGQELAGKNLTLNDSSHPESPKHPAPLKVARYSQKPNKS